MLSTLPPAKKKAPKGSEEAAPQEPSEPTLTVSSWSVISAKSVNESADVFCERGGRSNKMAGNALFRAFSKALTPSLRIAQQTAVSDSA